MPLTIKPQVSTKTRVEVTALGNGDGVVDPTLRQTKGKNKGATDCVKLSIIQNGQIATKYVSFSEYFGPKYKHLGSVKFREKLIYGAGKRSFKTSVGKHVFDVKWRFKSGATKKFKDLVRKQSKRENMNVLSPKPKAKTVSELINETHSKATLLKLGVDLSKIADK